MAVATKNDGKKWIQTSVAITCIILAYICQSFFETLGEWFDLEALLPNFDWIVRALSIIIGFTTFLVIVNRNQTATFLKEVYAESIKVVWPDKSQTVRMNFWNYGWCNYRWFLFLDLR
jgi:hypothetical protein